MINSVEPLLTTTEKQIKTLKEVVQQAERQHILMTLRQCGGDRGTAARLLKIDRKTMYRKLKSFQDIKLVDRRVLEIQQVGS